MPGLLKAIQDAHRAGQLKERPRGPLGKDLLSVVVLDIPRYSEDRSPLGRLTCGVTGLEVVIGRGSGGLCDWPLVVLA